MASFDIAVNKVLNWEGGYQDNLSDSGNYDSNGYLVGTNYGITASTLLRVMNLPISKAGMESMQKDYAKQVYYNGFWLPYKINEIENQKIANIVLDTLVLFSYNTAISLLTDAISQTLHEVYNNINPQLLNDISNKGLESHFVNNLIDLRINYHNYRVQQNPTQEQFLKGWTNRANSFSEDITNILKPLLYVGVGGTILYFLLKKKKKK